MSENELVKPQAGQLAVPDYLKVADDHSLDTIKEYVRPPRIKVIQGMSDAKLKDAFGVGVTVLIPDNIIIMDVARDEKGNVLVGNTVPFAFTPLFFFAEFCLWNPMSMKGKLPPIRERSFDPNSQIAARARDFKNRYVACPEDPGKDCVYCEHLNFIVHVHSHNEPCILTFSRGEFKAGQSFAALAKMRGVPLYGNIFHANLAFRKNDKGEWYGLDISNPSGGASPFVGEEAFQGYRILHEQYAELYASRKIEVNYEDEPIDAVVSDAADTM